MKFRGVLQALLAALLLVALISWNPADPSLNAASGAPPTNWLGLNGALFADLFMQSLGLAAWPAALLVIAFGLARAIGDAIQQRLKPSPIKALSATAGTLLLSGALAALAEDDGQLANVDPPFRGLHHAHQAFPRGRCQGVNRPPSRLISKLLPMPSTPISNMPTTMSA